MVLQAVEWSVPLIRVAIPVAAALAGGTVGAAGTGGRGTLTGLLVHFAAGTFLAVALLDLLPEAAHSLGWTATLLAAAAGAALSFWLARLSGGFCPGCSSGDDHAPPLPLTTPLLGVIAFHCALDGLALAGAAGHSAGGTWISLAVLAHKVPEGMAVAALCRAAGMDRNAAFWTTGLVEAATFLGFLGGLHAGESGASFLGLALALTAGSFLFLVTLTLSGSRRSDRPARNMAAALAGGALLAVAQLALPH